MQFERKHYIYIIFAIVLSLIAIDGTETIINYNNYTNGSSNGSFYETINMNENNISEVGEIRNNGTTYTPYIRFLGNKIEGGVKFVGVDIPMYENSILGYKSFYNLNMTDKQIINCSNCGTKTDLNLKVNKSGDNITGNLNLNSTTYSGIYGYNYTDCMGSLTTNDYANNRLGVQVWAVGRCLVNNVWSLGKYGENKGYAMSFVGDRLWKSNHSTRGFRIQVFQSNETAYTDFFQSNEYDTNIYQGNLTISTLAGTGYEFACLDPNGKLIRSAMSCDLI